jgi:hypothetical protein
VLLLTLATATPRLAPKIIRSIALLDGATDAPSTATNGGFAKYKPAASYGTTFDKLPSTAAQIPTTDAPRLSLLASAFVKFATESEAVEGSFSRNVTFADENAKEQTAAESAFRFMMTLEVDARVIRDGGRRITPELGEKWKKIGRVRPLSSLKEACVKGSFCATPAFADECKAWKSGGVPLGVFACVSEFVSSHEFLPMADHPMSNPWCFVPPCGGCDSLGPLEHRYDFEFAECFPTKQGSSSDTRPSDDEKNVKAC